MLPECSPEMCSLRSPTTFGESSGMDCGQTPVPGPVVTSAAGVGMGERGAGPHPSLTEPLACRPLTTARSSTCFHSLYCCCLRRQGDRQGRVRAARGPPSGGEGALQKEGPLRASGCLLHGYSQANGHCRWEPSAPPCADSAGTHCTPVSGAAATAPSRFWASF